MKTFILICVTAVGSLASGSVSAATDPVLARQGYEIMKKYCHRCHGVSFTVDGLDVLDLKSLTKDRGADLPHWLKPGDLDGSFLWDRVGVRQDMPPAEAAQPTDEERATLKQWILAGAEYPVQQARVFLSEEAVLLSIRDHLQTVPQADRKFQRYLSLHAMFNNQKQVSPTEMRLGRAALAKLVNSLSWKTKIVSPLAIDSEQTVFRIDLRDYGWDKKNLWEEVVKVYPYGLKQSSHQDDSVRRLADEIRKLSGDDLSYVRADWFVATASRPPLYHTMLELPENISELRERLNVSPKTDFIKDDLARAGLITSKVSKQNRLLDRHNSRYGYYWESYDFKQNDGTGSLIQFPLGPKFPNHPFAFQAFEHDGGEMIFSLPNGLQGYYLSNAKGERINEGPIEIVSDSTATSGNNIIVNGLSCMNCHSRGIVRFEAQEALRDATTFSGSVRDKVQSLYKRQSEFETWFAKDETRFLKAVELAAGKFLQDGEDAGKPIGEIAEPIGVVARWYVRDLSPEVVAAEMGIEDPAEVKAMIKANRRLGKAGLAPLEKGGTVKRDVWSAIKEGTSPYYEFAKELILGDPLFVKQKEVKKEKAADGVVQVAVKSDAKKDAKADGKVKPANGTPAITKITPKAKN